MTKAVTRCVWGEVPHLSQSAIDGLLASYPPHERDARTRGEPGLGAGAIYPVEVSAIVCDPFEIPVYWPKCFGMDVGWNRTAVVWGAKDQETDVVYLWSEHYRGQAEPVIHAEAIRARGSWIPGAIDPAARGRSQVDGQQLYRSYLDLGLNISPAQNGVESGIYDVWQRLSTGRLKVFSTLQDWFGEYRLYRRDLNGKVHKERDHLMDATRYLVATGLDLGCLAPDAPQRLARQMGLGRQQKAYDPHG